MRQSKTNSKRNTAVQRIAFARRRASSHMIARATAIKRRRRRDVNRR